MPYFVMQFPDDVEHQHQLLYSLVCAVLVRHCQDETLYFNHYQTLFGGGQSFYMLSALKTELTQLSRQKHLPASLPQLVRTYLIPKLNTSGDLPTDYIAAFERVMGSTVVVHTTYPGEIGDDGFHILKADNIYNALINELELSEEQKAHLNPHPKAVHCLALEGLIQRGFNHVSQKLSIVPKYLTIRSTRALTETTLFAPPVNDVKELALRGDNANVTQLIHAIKKDAVKVDFEDTKKDNWTNFDATAMTIGTGIGVGTIALAVELSIEFEWTLTLGGYAWFGPFPLTLIAVVLGAAVGVYGTQNANRFHQSLRETLVFLQRGDIDEAMNRLEQEISTHWGKQFTQWLLVTKEHHAFHHFFYAACHQHKKNYDAAYVYYNKAKLYAKQANRTFLTFSAQFQEIRMLKNLQDSIKTQGVKTKLNTALKDFAEDNPMAVLDLYSQLINHIRELSQAFSQDNDQSQVDPKRLTTVINEFLQFNDFYLLTYCSKAEGAFLILFGQFCQGLLLGYLGNRDSTYLEENTKNSLRALVIETRAPTLRQYNELFTFALAKMRTVLNGLKNFKQQHPAQMGDGTAIHQALAFMEPYMVEFIAHGDEKASNFDDALRDAKEALNLNDQKADQVITAVNYSKGLLENLMNDFGATFYSVEAWLGDKSQGGMLSTKGNTPLHLLVQIPMIPEITRKMVMEKLNRLSQYMLIMNDDKETPLTALLENDPYQLKGELGKRFYYQTALVLQGQNPLDPVQLVTTLQNAADLGCKKALEEIPAQLNSPSLTAEQCFALGRLYYDGQEEIAKNYQLAMECFDRAGRLGSAAGYYNVGEIYRRGGEGVTQDLRMASMLYTVAMQNGYVDKNELKKTHDKLVNEVTPPAEFEKSCQKAFEKAYVHRFLNDENNTLDKKKTLDKLDDDDETLLHRAARQKIYKNCARLIMFGSDKDKKNKRETLPFAGLTPSELKKITDLQTQLNTLKQDLDKPIDELLEKIIKIDTKRIVPDIMRKAIRELSALPDIKPLLELAKLASLKLHSNAKRERFKEGYDSDNDNEERMTDKQALSIQISAIEEHINTIFHAGQDGQMGNGCYGAYTQGGNTIYVGGGRDPEDVRGTLIHELTHFLAYEVFENDCKPYAYSRGDLRMEFTKITNRISKEYKKFPDKLSLIKRVFDYEPSTWHAELIVRIPQIIAANPNNGLRLLGTHVPDLLEYYRYKFLPALEQHTKTLRTRALSMWDEKLFPESTAPYTFELR